jgi:RNA polymerase sigma-70 factor (ECF subfamily)
MRNGDGLTRDLHRREAVLAGDESAWRAWYEESYAQLEAYVLWRCAQLRDLSDDVLQETWLTAVRSIRRFQPQTGNFLGWLRGIAVNVIRNQLRQRRRRERRQQPLLGEPSRNGEVHSDDARERSERIAQALAALPDQYESVLRAKYLDQLAVAEIAVLWNETPKAVESLLTRARAAFRETYTQQEHDR